MKPRLTSLGLPLTWPQPAPVTLFYGQPMALSGWHGAPKVVLFLVVQV